MDPDASLVDPTLVVGSGLLLDVPTPVVDAAIVEEEPVAVEPGEVITNTERPEQEEAVALAVPTTHTPSASGEEAVVEDELLQDILATDMDDLVEAMSHRSIQQSTAGHHSDDVDMASIATPYGGFSLHDLFGQHFHTELMKTTTNGSLHDTELGTTAAVYDPELLDSRTFVEALFGSNVDEAMIDTAFGQEGPLRDLMLATAAADARSDVEDLFGLHALSHMEESKVEDSTKRSGGFAILHATLPNIPAVSDKTIGELWLAELPRVDPNRQVLHVEPTSFHPSRVTIPRSNDRRLYTADNVMRWAYLKERKEVLSNARLVKWSDGSRTVHVGRDRFEIASSTQQSLSLLSAPTTLYKSEKVMPGVVGVQGYEQRVLLKVSDAPSISSALVSETQAHRHIGIERRLSVLTDAPLPRLDAKKPRNEMTPAEEWVMKEREKRRKEMVRLAAAGTPMSLADQLEAERRMIQTLQSCEDVKELLDAQDEEIGHAVSADTRRQRNRREVAEPTIPYQDFETLLAGMNAESNPDAASRKRERSEEPQEEEARLHLNRSDTALTVDASRKVEAVAMLERVQSLIPETSEVSSYIGSITTMLGDAAHNWTLSSLQAELSQITSDIRSELGSSAPEEAIQMLASLQR